VKLKDLTGQQFGRLKVIRRSNQTSPVRWHCECKCGRTLDPLSGNLVRGDIRSCGCLRKRTCAETGLRNITHGYSLNGKVRRTYKSWQSMKQRCGNPRAPNYKNYGSRGITVCKHWLNSFENFLADMGERPEGKTLDRYPDNNGNYESGNCRWATAKQQIANRRRSTA